MKGRHYLNTEEYKKALEEFERALEYPDNMMVAQPYRGGRESQVYYYMGLAREKLGLIDQAELSYHMVVDQRLSQELSDLYYYRGMALRKLGQEQQAMEIFNGLIKEGKGRLNRQEVDFFAKFGERETPEDKAAEAWYFIALGHLGKNEKNEAKEAFQKAVDLNLNHVWAAENLSQLK
jgi:tetratricopeptide (TPR) repeat protein